MNSGVSNSLWAVPSGLTAQLSIIDTTSNLANGQLASLVEPPMYGMELAPAFPSWSFLIESQAGDKVLFDLGVSPRWSEQAPLVLAVIDHESISLSVEKGVADILNEHGIQPEEIDSIIWSHWHFDHIGDPSTFPNTTELVVGPGFVDAFLPGFPARNNSPILETDYANRDMREIDFQQNTIEINGFRAIDFFQDGSFYLLDAPGHSLGHLAGLVRTTENTFIMLGADAVHHNGEIRPSPLLPLPKNVANQDVANARPYICPGELLEALQINRSRALDEPFFDAAVSFNASDLIETEHKIQEADASSNVLFIYSHDRDIRGVVDLFPATANHWYRAGWRQQLLWKFLDDFTPALINVELESGD